MYRISIIMPIFNVEKYLKRALDSIINQTMDFRDIEVIMVDDCSTDNSKKIIEEYSNQYPNFIGIYRDKNSGCAAIPRNNGLDVASGRYIMFLDPDDEYFLNACETLYNTIEEYDVDVVFGRYVRRYDNKEIVEKSFSPFIDNIINKYDYLVFDEVKEPKLRELINFIFCGKRTSDSNPRDIIQIKNINQEPLLLNIAPSVWTKIYKREVIFGNDIDFPPFRLGEDSAFVLKTLLNANGIVFLNNFLVCNYSVRESSDDQSVSKNINFKLLVEGIENPIYCSECVKKYSKEIRIFAVNPQVLYWFFLWRQSSLSKDENKFLINKLYELKKIASKDLRTRLLLFFVINFIRFSNY